MGITDLSSLIYLTWLLYGLFYEYNRFKMVLNNNLRAKKSEGKK